MIIKVCGMREAANIRAVEALGIDLMGFIFWPGSRRYVSQLPAYLPTACRRVGVFVDAPVGDIVQHADSYQLHAIQLHGHESPAAIRQLRQQLPHADTSIIKALNIATTADLRQAAAYEGVADVLLFDTKGPSVGGNGQQFDWHVLAAYTGATPFLLSGGIGPDDVRRVHAFRHPRCLGIDLNSRFESSPAVKDTPKIASFIHQLKHYEQD